MDLTQDYISRDGKLLRQWLRELLELLALVHLKQFTN